MYKETPDHSAMASPSSRKVVPVDMKERSRMDNLMSEFISFDPTASHEFVGHTDQAWGCAITCDNSIIFTAAGDHLIKMWDIQTKMLICDLTGHTDVVYGLEVTPDDKYLISIGWDMQILIWDIQKRFLTGVLGTHTNQIFALWVSADGNHVVTGGRDSKAKVWDFHSRSLLGEMHCGGDSVFGLTATSDKAEIITVDGTANIRIFGFTTYASISVHPTGDGVPQCITITNDKKYLIFGTRTFHVVVWNYADKTLFHSFNTHIHWVRGVIVTPDNQFIISASADKTVRFHNLVKKTEELKLNAGGFINAEYLSKDCQYLACASTDKVISLWKVGVPIHKVQMTGHTNTVISIVVSPDDKYAITGSEDCTVRIWSLANLSEVACLTGHGGGVWAVAITENMSTVLSASADSKVFLWDFQKKINVGALEATGVLYALAVSADNKFVAASGNQMKMYLWNLETKSLIKVMDGHTDTVFAIKFTADCKQIISGGADYTIRIWDVLNPGVSRKIDSNSGMIESLCMNSQETYLAFGDRDNQVHLWDWQKKKHLKTFKCHTNWVKAIDFASDGKTFMSSSSDKTVKIFNAEEQTIDCVLNGHTAFVRCGVFSRDGRYCLTTGNDKTIRVWDLLDVKDMQLRGVKSEFDTMMYLSKIKKKLVPDLEMASSVFGKLKINILHFYAYLGYDRLLKKALHKGAEIRIDDDGHSPLYYVIDRKCQECIDVILLYMIDIENDSFDKFRNFGHAMRDDFDVLLKNRSEYLPDFLEKIFYVIPDTISFAIPIKTLPILKYTEDKDLNANFFIRSGTNKITGEVPVLFKTLPFSIHCIKGSSGSMNLLKCITECPNKLILEADFLKTFIRNKWDDLWPFILFLTLLIWANVVLMIVILIPSDKDNLPSYYIPVALGFLGVNVVLFLYEIIQFISVGLSYFTDMWNLVDIARLSCCFFWVIMSYYDNQEYIRYIACAMVGLNFLRGLSGFKAFDNTRYYTKLIIRAFQDSISFLVVFFYSTLGFGVIFYASTLYYETNTDSLFKWSYELNMGGFSTSGYDNLNYFCFMIASIMNVIIILNLLISILGDSFTKFQAEEVQIDVFEMAEYILEIETMMMWNRRVNLKKFLYKCEDTSLGDNLNWEGRIRMINKVVSSVKILLHENFEIIHKKNDEILSKLNK